jgi:hypothetical protein
MLWWLLWQATADWDLDTAQTAYWALLAWMVFSKFVKLITHFVRYPVDVLLWPVSILFGWFHGAIKMYALITLSEVRQSTILQSRNADTECRQPGAAALVQMLTTRIV